jgi:hypothetical protein
MQLEMNTGRRPRPDGAGERKPIPPHLMYSSPCSASCSVQQQRVHAIESDEVDHGNFLQTQDHNLSNLFKR